MSWLGILGEWRREGGAGNWLTVRGVRAMGDGDYQWIGKITVIFSEEGAPYFWVMIGPDLVTSTGCSGRVSSLSIQTRFRMNEFKVFMVASVGGLFVQSLGTVPAAMPGVTLQELVVRTTVSVIGGVISTLVFKLVQKIPWRKLVRRTGDQNYSQNQLNK